MITYIVIDEYTYYMTRKPDRVDDREPRHANERKPRSPEKQPLCSRRSYLKLGAAVAVGFPTTVGVSRAATAERHGIGFRRVLDAVDDLGMDPTGGDPVDDGIVAAGDGALIRFPDGVYRFDDDPRGISLDGETRGFEGAGDDITFRAPRDRRGFLLDGVGMEGAYINNIVIDQTAPNTCIGIRLWGGRVVVRDIVARGEGDRHDSGTPLLSASTSPPDGTSSVEDGTGADSSGSGRRRGLLVEGLDRTPRHSESSRDPDASGTDTLTIEGTGVATNYEITVDGRIDPETPPSGYGLSGSNSEGTIESDTVGYAVDGTITDFRLAGDANVFLNDDQVNPDALGSTSPDRLVFDASGTPTTYAFSVGRLYPNDSANTAPETGDLTSDTVSEGLDVYRFDGGIASLFAEGTATLSFYSRAGD